MDKPLLNMTETIDYDENGKKLCYINLKKYPSTWKQQLNRIYKKI